VVIERSRLKISLALAGVVLFLVAGWFLIRSGDPTGVLIGWVGIVVFGLFGVAGVAMMLRRGPGLVVDDEGFTDSSSVLAMGRVPWSDVVNVWEWKATSTTNIVVTVRDPEAYLARLRGPARWAARANVGMVGSPVALASTGLRISSGDLLELLTSRLRAYQERHPVESDGDVGGRR
jgi:hypothetical protein